MTSPVHTFNETVEAVLDEISAQFGMGIPEEQKRFYAIKLFERDDKITDLMQSVPDVSDLISRAEEAMDDDAESIITNERYTYISSIIKDCYKKKRKEKLSASDKIDRVVTNRWAALPILRLLCSLFTMCLLRQSARGRQTGQMTVCLGTVPLVWDWLGGV